MIFLLDSWGIDLNAKGLVQLQQPFRPHPHLPELAAENPAELILDVAIGQIDAGVQAITSIRDPGQPVWRCHQAAGQARLVAFASATRVGGSCDAA